MCLILCFNWILREIKRKKQKKKQQQRQIFCLEKFLQPRLSILEELFILNVILFFFFFLVIDFIKSEPDVISYWLWLLTALGAGFSLFSSSVSLVASVIKSASNQKKGGTMFLLLISHIASGNYFLLLYFDWKIYNQV